MGATLATLVNRVQSNAAETGIEFSSEAEIKQWIQEAHARLAETGYLTAQVTASLVAQQLKYDISGWIGTSSDRQVFKLQDVEIRNAAEGTNWYRCFPKPFWEIRKQLNGVEITDTDGAFSSYSNASVPRWYCWEGVYLYLWPPSSYATDGSNSDPGLRLTFTAIELIDDDTDTTSLPPKGEDAVIAYCLALRANKDGDLRTHGYKMAEFERVKQEITGWYQGNRSDWPERIAASERRGGYY